MRTTKKIDIEIVRHASSDLRMAFSEDLPGLLVSGRSETEIDERLPGAIREILEAEGNKNVMVTIEPEHSDLPSTFISSKFKANVSLDHAT